MFVVFTFSICHIMINLCHSIFVVFKKNSYCSPLSKVKPQKFELMQSEVLTN